MEAQTWEQNKGADWNRESCLRLWLPSQLLIRIVCAAKSQHAGHAHTHFHQISESGNQVPGLPLFIG